MVSRRALILIAVCLGLGYVQAAEVEVGVDVNSAYVWRGRTLNDGVVVQPAIDISMPSGFGINVWGNLDVGDYDGSLEEGAISRIEVKGSYGFDVGPVACDVGYIEYLFPWTGSTNTVRTGTREVYAVGEIPIVGGMAARVAVYYDFDEVKDIYANLGLIYAFEISDGWSTEMSTLAGNAGRDASAGEDGGLHEYTFSLSTTYDVGESVVFGASLAYTDTFDKDVLPEQDVNVHGGFSLAYGF